MYQLEKPIFFYLLFAIVGLMVIFLLVFIWKKHTQKKFAHSKALRLLSPNRSFFKSWINCFIYFFIKINKFLIKGYLIDQL
jgi:Ca-activated chloride channel family protein